MARKVRDVAGVFQVLYPPEEGTDLIQGAILIGEMRPTINKEEIDAHVRPELPAQRPAGD